MNNIQNERLATIVSLAEKQPGLGRTAMMKLCYFLQTLRNVPLEYKFTLYSYGPFDSSVLSDLSSAESLGGIKSDTILYAGGYGYAISPSEGCPSVKALAADFLRRYDTDLDWVIGQFGSLTSKELEILSTIVYVDREAARAKQKLLQNKLAERVHNVKPHFSKPYISEKATELKNLGLLKGIKAAPSLTLRPGNRNNP